MDFGIEILSLLLPIKAVQEDPSEEPENVFMNVLLNPGLFVLKGEDAGRVEIQPSNWRSDVTFWVDKEELSNKCLSSYRGE